MGDYDSSPMLYCSGLFSHKNSVCFRGLGNSTMFAHDSSAAFVSIYKKTSTTTTTTTTKRGYDSSPLLLFARAVTVPLNFS